MPLSQYMLAVFDLLTICCTHSENGGTQKLKINQIHHHEKTCKFRKGKKERGPHKKVKLYDANTDASVSCTLSGSEIHKTNRSSTSVHIPAPHYVPGVCGCPRCFKLFSLVSTIVAMLCCNILVLVDRVRTADFVTFERMCSEKPKLSKILSLVCFRVRITTQFCVQFDGQKWKISKFMMTLMQLNKILGQNKTHNAVWRHL